MDAIVQFIRRCFSVNLDASSTTDSSEKLDHQRDQLIHFRQNAYDKFCLKISMIIFVSGISFTGIIKLSSMECFSCKSGKSESKGFSRILLLGNYLNVGIENWQSMALEV